MERGVGVSGLNQVVAFFWNFKCQPLFTEWRNRISLSSSRKSKTKWFSKYIEISYILKKQIFKLKTV